MQLDRSCLLDLFAPVFVVLRLQIYEGYARASLVALRKNLLRWHRHLPIHFPPNCMVTALGCSGKELRIG
jgi:hypothetical protein